MSRSASNRLPILATEIQAAHADVERGARAVAERAIAAGHGLIEAKKLVGHGGWSAWLTQHTGFSERHARRYMAIARSGLKSATVAEMGLAAAAEATTTAEKRWQQEMRRWWDQGRPEWQAAMRRVWRALGPVTLDAATCNAVLQELRTIGGTP